MLVVALAVLQVLLWQVSPLHNLSPDEAYYWEWSRRLDIAYFSKGPVIAILIAASTAVFGDSELAVRLPAIVCLMLFSGGLYLFLRQLSDARHALLGLIAARAMLVFAYTGVIVTTDPPTAVAWLLVIAAGCFAINNNEYRWWILAGAALALGFLTKYTTALLFPCIVGFLCWEKPLRKHLRSRSFVLGTSFFLLALLVIFYWNATHDWVNFKHNAKHVVRKDKLMPTLRYFCELLGGQLGLAGPLLFVGICWAWVRGLKRWFSGDAVAGYLVVTSLPLFLFCIAVSLFKRVYANWPMPAYIGGLVLVVYLVFNGELTAQKRKRFVLPAILLSAAITFFAHGPLVGIYFGLPGKLLPMKKLYGWSELGARVDHLIEANQNILGSEPVVITKRYAYASEIAFYSDKTSSVYSDNISNRKMNQYDVWGAWEKLEGKNALVVLSANDSTELIAPRFSILRRLNTEPLELVFRGRFLHDFSFYIGENFDGSSPKPPSNF